MSDGTTRTLDRGGPAGPDADGIRRSPRRLVVELTDAAVESLDDLTKREQVNKTTVVNRALKLYRLLRHAEDTGGKIYILTDRDRMERIHFI